MYEEHNCDACSYNHCCSGRAITITYCESLFVAPVIQHAMHMCRIILSFVACPVLQYFSILSHKWYDFRKKKNLKTEWFLGSNPAEAFGFFV
jgi:hypothetical protein